jgi:membrane fusion protein, copper/silver efflux system
VRFNIDNPQHEDRPEASLKPGMFASVRVDVPAAQLGEKLAARGGKVLAVPEGAVVFTGGQKVVFRQEAPAAFDGVQVELGPLVAGVGGEGFYPVLKGLTEGDRVVTSGSYLLDAETRVSASAGSIYYGGTGAGSKGGGPNVVGVRPSTPEDLDEKVKAGLAKLSTPDRRLAKAQKLCPVLGSRLGSMGAPVKVVLKGMPVLLCCKGCEDEAKEHPEKTLARVESLKKKGTAPGGAPSPPARDRQAKVKANLAKLSDEDRRLAEAQKYCAVLRGKLLGSMGKPIKVMVKGEPVFVCCAGCEDEALEDPAATLGVVERLRAKAKAEKGGGR